MRRPKRREPALPPWDLRECPQCAVPVRTIYLDDGGPLYVGMKPAPLIDKRATVAATVMNSKLVGRWRNGSAPQAHETVWIPHGAVCEAIPRPEQLALPAEGE